LGKRVGGVLGEEIFFWLFLFFLFCGWASILPGQGGEGEEKEKGKEKGKGVILKSVVVCEKGAVDQTT
jgi:hypothetical protein